jgi:uncharacterized lipoprotein YddW (UPF0748 family)
MKILLLIAFVVSACCTAAANPPPIAREARAAWIASVDNIDWPSKAGLPVAQQKEELISMLDRAVALNLNIIVLQVRPGCDALYKSDLEPWSEYLTGNMGVAPSPFYDPLQFAIQEAHQRGLELHAWLNPFRARYHVTRGAASSNHVSHTKTSWVKKYGDWLWLDPGENEARDHSMKVFLDVVRRYDIDGIHMDDYFYPYKVNDVAGARVDFPDAPSWERYVTAGGALSRSDWRRENINQFIEKLYRNVKSEKPWVRVGISPFGIWRPGFPESIEGYDAYEFLYADARKWLAQGWLDYFVPQLYWSIDAKKQSYPVLLRWWHEQNENKRHLWPGNSIFRTGQESGVEEALKQVQVTRAQPGATGNVFWSMKCLAGDRGAWAERLRDQFYSEPALVPSMTWLDATPLTQPAVTSAITGNDLIVNWRSIGDQAVHRWVLQKRTGSHWTTEFLSGTQNSQRFTKAAAGGWPEEIGVTAVSRLGQASNPVVLQTAKP